MELETATSRRSSSRSGASKAASTRAATASASPWLTMSSTTTVNSSRGQPRHRVLRPHRLLQAFGHGAQHAVADRHGRANR